MQGTLRVGSMLLIGKWNAMQHEHFFLFNTTPKKHTADILSRTLLSPTFENINNLLANIYCALFKVRIYQFANAGPILHLLYMYH